VQDQQLLSMYAWNDLQAAYSLQHSPKENASDGPISKEQYWSCHEWSNWITGNIIRDKLSPTFSFIGRQVNDIERQILAFLLGMVG